MVTDCSSDLCRDCGSPRMAWNAHWKARCSKAGERCRDCYNTYCRNLENRRVRRPVEKIEKPKVCKDCGSDQLATHLSNNRAKYRCIDCYRAHERNRPKRVGRAPRRKRCHGCGDWYISGKHCGQCPSLGPRRPPAPAPKFIGPSLDNVRLGECVGCGITINTYRGKKWCHASCRHIASGRSPSRVDIFVGPCARCGVVFVGREDGSRCCSVLCSNRMQRSRQRAKRRARLKNVKTEPYTLREIADRDGWKCHLCGKKVPDRQYTADDNDPTIDHLVPISAQGDDIRSNVALAHNRCNWERGAGGVAQLRLVG
jgi:hypothetical protein